jgi:hypothetical protein
MREVALMTESAISRGRIFICYRHEDTEFPAAWLFDQLTKHFGEDQVFKDVDSIEPGDDFVDIIRQAVVNCDVLLVLIGNRWLTAMDQNGQRRVDDPADFVRLEIEAALTRKVSVIPILVGQAKMPRADDLPASLAGLARRHAIELNPSQFDPDTSVLIRVLDTTLAGLRTAQPGLGAAASGSKAQVERETQVQASQLGQPKMFLCYRREDTQGFARGIYESLAGKYGHERVFRDIDSTPAGVRYSTWIESRVSQCSVMIVLIGNAWLTAKDPAGQRRLDLPKDWVRQEIEAALRRSLPIIPVRVQGAPMPSEDELPPSIADLSGFQSAEVTDSRWAFDVGLLIQAIDNLITFD